MLHLGIIWRAHSWVKLELLMLQLRAWPYPQIGKIVNVNEQKSFWCNRWQTQKQFINSNVCKESKFFKSVSKQICFSQNFLFDYFTKLDKDSILQKTELEQQSHSTNSLIKDFWYRSPMHEKIICLFILSLGPNSRHSKW